MGFSFWIDRGGTFTDVIARHPDGQLVAHKLLSVSPGNYDDAASHAIRQILSSAGAHLGDIDVIKMGTTVATNALLEQNGEPTALLITRGLRDTVLIGQQHRAALFALSPTRAEPLYQAVYEIGERVNAQGDIIHPLDTEDARHVLHAAKQAGFRALAIAFAHSYRNPEHEKIVAQMARDLGFEKVVTSSDVSPLIKLVPRADTALVDAYLSPILDRYSSLVRTGTGNAPLYFMQSHGGLATFDQFSGKDAILSGPAGGLVAAFKLGQKEGINRLITFDMGGTSTDVAAINGTLERASQTNIAGVRLQVPMMDIHTVAAGGGSICRIENGRFLVGPSSAGANPGPACYGRGGPLTLTDCNILLGRLCPDHFPRIFGASGDEALDVTAAQKAMDALLAVLPPPDRPCPEDAAIGFLSVGVDHMARAIKRITLRRGEDAALASLLTFGGAGGQHAAHVADALGVTDILIPPFSGLLSALGMGLADQSTVRESAVMAGLDDADGIAKLEEDLVQSARQQLVEAGIKSDEIRVQAQLYLREKGSDTSLPVTLAASSQMIDHFQHAHEKTFGFKTNPALIEADKIRVEASGGGADIALHAHVEAAEPQSQSLYLEGVLDGPSGRGWQRVDAVRRSSIAVDKRYPGPLMILEEGGTVLVPDGWVATRSDTDMLRLQKQTQDKAKERGDITKPSPILLELFNNRFMTIAEEMGAVLERTAHSVNIKERLDFSCALFDAQGDLIANAPHMPVHLGSMGDSVKACIKAAKTTGHPFKSGDCWMLNDPFNGGTHLPDITLVSPVTIAGSAGLDFYVASRGHHADIGGIVPGSMPAHSTDLAEEGIVFDAFPLVVDGEFQQAPLVEALKQGPYPARNVDQNSADLKAQVAALARGSALLTALVEEQGLDLVRRYMAFIQDNAEQAVRRLLPSLKTGTCQYALDTGQQISVTLTLSPKKDRACIDFTGTSQAAHDNYNAPLSVVKAAVLYVFRVLTGEDIPMNQGCLKPLDLIVPKGCMLNPAPGHAVVAGNVETSQAVVNALFLATKTLAASQGTMNNLIFGNERLQYYETLAGGMGASASTAGESALHSHMTNSRLTDPEILESRYPVRVVEHRLRRGSGGAGLRRGGDGMIREIEFLAPMALSILSLCRDIAPPGLAGGQPGKPGRNLLIKRTGETHTLPYKTTLSLEAGDRIRIETPGGGGYGTPIDRP